jgi:signal transduction histidine kinase
MFQSLRIRLTALFVALTILPLVIVGVLIASRGSETLQAESVKFQSQVARQVSISLEAFFNERRNELLVLTQVYGFGSLESSAQREILLALLSKQPAYYKLALVKMDGQEAISLIRGKAVNTSDLGSRANDPLFQNVVKTKKVGFSQIRFDDAARDRLLTIAVPIEDLFTGEVGNVLVAELRFQNVEETVLRNFNLEGEDVFVVDPDGVVIAHRNPSLVVNKTVFKLPKTSGRAVGLDGSDVVLAMDTIQLEESEMIVVADTTYANATALATDLSRIAALITLGALLIASAIVVFVVTRVVNPIGKLSDIAKAIQSGDFSKRSTLTRKDEIGQLGTAVNEMSVAIQKRETDLREQADELRVATAKAKEAARVKGEFLANMSHELRTPLNAIIGFSDMLLAGMVGPLTDKQHHKMERLKENGQRLLTLINDLLDLTRMEAGRLEVAQKPFSPRALADRTTSQMESLAVEGNLKFEMQISPDLPTTLVGDEKRVEQVIVNLLANAFKFTKEGSVILEMKPDFAEQTWTIAVSDTGIGIPPHAVNIIFEEFRQLDGSYSRAYKGSGLGLTITRNLVRMMSGKISVKSTLGSGSTFTVILPMALDDNANVPVSEAAVHG